jgi:5-methylcytosine-specific restriction endonuclease McrA
MEDDEVRKKSGVYSYVLTKDDRYLNLRAFSEKEKREAYERQKGKCVECGEKFDIGEMEADHIKPWHKGGKTTAANCQMLCMDDNRRKGGK